MKTKLLLFVIFSLVLSVDIQAQCAMCKAAVEANLEAGDNIGAGLNTGILYLMAMPYIAVFLFGFFWYKQHKKVGQ